MAKARGGAALKRACADVEALRAWVEKYCGIRVATTGVCAGHDAPMAYLAGAYFEPARDMVVWAPRGGGKTRLGAVATLLDLLHKPGCEVRILGGSLEQSLKMWGHLEEDVDRVAGKMLKGKMTGRRVALTNGSKAAVLTQSQRAVRGVRVQKLRCDEVECFDPLVWEAAQLVTRSGRSELQRGKSGRDEWGVMSEKKAGGRRTRRGSGAGKVVAHEVKVIAGVVEAVSTWHLVGGVMERAIESAGASGVRVVRWCLMEVLERCPAERECATCPLWDDCGGRAKTLCDGFVSIDDAIAMKRRVSRETWEAEMLCRRPTRRGCVFPGFDESAHVRDESAVGSGQSAGKSGQSAEGESGEMWLALDFGFANPFVCLWIWSEEGSEGRSFVVDEYVQPMRTMLEHVEQIEARRWGAVKKVACDPAGAGRNDQTAESNVQVLRGRGYQVRYRKSLIVEGLEMVRTALRPASGHSRLFIHPRCVRLIKAMKAYRYPEGGGELPVKDGEHDHLIDALRYYFVNHAARGDVKWRVY